MLKEHLTYREYRLSLPPTDEELSSYHLFKASISGYIRLPHVCTWERWRTCWGWKHSLCWLFWPLDEKGVRPWQEKRWAITLLALGLKITVGQRTMSGQDDQLSGQTFDFPVVLTRTWNKWPRKKYIFTPLGFKRTCIFFPLNVCAC